MNKIKLKIVSVDELSQSLLISFSDSDSEPEDSATYAFQPYFFGDIPKNEVLKMIAQSCLSISENQKKLKQAIENNSVIDYQNDIGTVFDIDTTLPTQESQASDNIELKILIRAILEEEGVI